MSNERERGLMLEEAKMEGNCMEAVNHLSGVAKSVRYNQPQSVQIQMTINSYFLLFGVPLLMTVIILGSVVVGGYFLGRSVIVPNLTINPPKVEASLNVPPPTINNMIKPSDVPVIVNVPPTNITVRNNLAEVQPPTVHVTIPEGKQGQVQIVEKIVEKKVEVPVPIYVETADQAAVTILDIYPLCEKFIDEYISKLGKDPKIEQKRWLDLWNSKVAEIGDEQRAANESLINRRSAFKVDTAKTDEIVEVCRVMLRYRDAKLSIPSAFKEVMTADNLFKLKNYLAKGPILTIIK